MNFLPKSAAWIFFAIREDGVKTKLIYIKNKDMRNILVANQIYFKHLVGEVFFLNEEQFEFLNQKNILGTFLFI